MRGGVLAISLLEFEQAVQVGRNGDRWVLGACVFMDARFEESEWVILNSGLEVRRGDESRLETLGAGVIHNTVKCIGLVGMEMLLSFDVGTHLGAEFNIRTWLEWGFLSLGACSFSPGEFLGIQINELTSANGLGHIVATAALLLNVQFFIDSGTQGNVGGGCVDSKHHDGSLLGGGRLLLGVGALVALAFVVMVAAVVASTFA